MFLCLLLVIIDGSASAKVSLQQKIKSANSTSFQKNQNNIQNNTEMKR